MDIERKAEIASRVLIWMSVPVVIVLDLFAAWALAYLLAALADLGIRWLAMLTYPIPILLVCHGVVLMRKKDEVWEFLWWGLGPPLALLVGFGLLAGLGVLPRMGA